MTLSWRRARTRGAFVRRERREADSPGRAGRLGVQDGRSEIRWHKPVVYQEKDGARQEIAARYAINEWNRVGFELAKYDASTPLYIDPLIFSTYLGGSGMTMATASPWTALATLTSRAGPIQRIFPR